MFNFIFSFEAYLIAITKNQIIKKLKRKAYEHAHLAYFSREQHAIMLPQLSMELEEIDLIADMALNQLSPQQKQIFLLFAHENKSQSDIANQLHLSIRTVEHQIYLAKKKLSAYLKK